MKFRSSFVTNSSSSSYICDVCNRAEGGYDLSLSDVEMYECENGHTVCDDEIITYDIDDIEEIVHKINAKNYLAEQDAIKEAYNSKKEKTYDWRYSQAVKVVLKAKMNGFETKEDLDAYMDLENAKCRDFIDKLSMLGFEEAYDLSEDFIYTTPETIYDIRYNMPSEFCPICQLKHITIYDALDTALNKLGITRKELDEMAREYLKENKKYE